MNLILKQIQIAVKSYLFVWYPMKRKLISPSSAPVAFYEEHAGQSQTWGLSKLLLFGPSMRYPMEKTPW